jgi:hypothetical protein
MAMLLELKPGHCYKATRSFDLFHQTAFDEKGGWDGYEIHEFYLEANEVFLILAVSEEYFRNRIWFNCRILYKGQIFCISRPTTFSGCLLRVC